LALRAEDLSLDLSGAAFSTAGNADRRQPGFFPQAEDGEPDQIEKPRRDRSARALEHYLAAFRDPSRVHAMCEDYRAGAGADFEIDKTDRVAGNKITIPMLALWGDAGIARAAATPLDTWKTWATNVSGSPVDSGHFLTEENPDVTAKALKEFFAAA
jgi:pimeloyl-ACP methyl ester carboxylesterase